jgi:hypothetical protein
MTATSHDTGARCLCVADHRPGVLEHEWHHILPLAMGGPDTRPGVPGANGVWLCPTAHTNTHEILREVLRNGGVLSWGTALARWPGLNRYSFALAHDGYRRFLAMHGTLT